MAGPVWVLSPHLLVAQAVTAALRSVGVPAETRRWESVLEEDVSESSTPLRPAVVIAIVDGVDNSAVVGHVEAFAQPGDVRVVVVSSADASTRWGGLLANDAVDVVTVTTSVGVAGSCALTNDVAATAAPPAARRLRPSATRPMVRRVTDIEGVLSSGSVAPLARQSAGGAM